MMDQLKIILLIYNAFMHNIMYGIMTEEIVIREIRIDEVTINYESAIVRCIALSWLVIHETELHVLTKE